MDNNQLLAISAIATILVALLGYLFTHMSNIRISQRSERLNRINHQLSDLYGPLYSLTKAGEISFKGFLSNYSYLGSVEVNPKWHLWLSTVFMPNNLAMYDLIVHKSDLLIEDDMPECLIDFCAHVNGYKTVIKQWDDGDYSQSVSINVFPKPLNEYCEHSFKLLKSEQLRILGKRAIY